MTKDRNRSHSEPHRSQNLLRGHDGRSRLIQLLGVILVAVTAGLAFTISQSLSQHDPVVIFGSQDFLHGKGEPIQETVFFSVDDPTAPYVMQIDNGGLTGTYDRVSSALIWLKLGERLPRI